MGIAILVVLFLALGTFFGVEDWGRSTPEAFAVAALVLAAIVVVLRVGRQHL
jgi:predicted negative regulator of RcsB-dependent stress response